MTYDLQLTHATSLSLAFQTQHLQLQQLILEIDLDIRYATPRVNLNSILLQPKTSWILCVPFDEVFRPKKSSGLLQLLHVFRPICFAACFGCFTCSRVVTGKIVDITRHFTHVPDLFRLLTVSPCNNNLIPSASQTVAITGFTNWISDQHCMYQSIFQVEPHFVGASGVCVCMAHT